MFVEVSIGANIFNEKPLEPVKAFITPTAVHFSIALLICILATIPTQSWTRRGLLAVRWRPRRIDYSGRIWLRIFSRFGSGIDLADRLFQLPFRSWGTGRHDLGGGAAQGSALGSRP